LGRADRSEWRPRSPELRSRTEGTRDGALGMNLGMRDALSNKPLQRPGARGPLEGWVAATPRAAPAAPRGPWYACAAVGACR
jgi:hypothetical protein